MRFTAVLVLSSLVRANSTSYSGCLRCCRRGRECPQFRKWKAPAAHTGDGIHPNATGHAAAAAAIQPVCSRRRNADLAMLANKINLREMFIFAEHTAIARVAVTS
jgi:hypothetical protein